LSDIGRFAFCVYRFALLSIARSINRDFFISILRFLVAVNFVIKLRKKIFSSGIL